MEDRLSPPPNRLRAYICEEGLFKVEEGKLNLMIYSSKRGGRILRK